MFNELVESAAVREQTKKNWTVALSGATQIACLAVLILIPLIYTQGLPVTALRMTLLAPAVPTPRPATQPPAAPASPAKRAARFIEQGVIHQPVRVPQHAEIVAEPPLAPDIAAGTDGNSGGGLLPFALGPGTMPVPAPPPAPAPEKTVRRRVGGEVQAAKLIFQVQPAYPVLAVQTRTQGEVVLRAVIGKDGSVKELEAVSGHPLLIPAALAAVKQWRYQPTLLNGDAVEVETVITVNFVLGQ